MSKRHLSLGLCMVLLLGSTCTANDQPNDTDSGQRKSAVKDLGWTLELYQNPKNECTRVQGHDSGGIIGPHLVKEMHCDEHR